MALEYTNRRGTTYYLHQTTTKTGRTRYIMKKTKGDGGPDALPDGYEIVETINGQVSIRKAKPREIYEFEEAVVRQALEQQGLKWWEVEVKGPALIIHEPVQRLDLLLSFIMPRDASADRIDKEARRRARYTPVAKLTLHDPKARTFAVQRWCYLGSIDNWIPLKSAMTLGDALDFLVPHLGQESFFNPI